MENQRRCSFKVSDKRVFQKVPLIMAIKYKGVNLTQSLFKKMLKETNRKRRLYYFHEWHQSLPKLMHRSKTISNIKHTKKFKIKLKVIKLLSYNTCCTSFLTEMGF